MQYKVITDLGETHLSSFLFINSSYDYTCFVHVDNIYLNYRYAVFDITC